MQVYDPRQSSLQNTEAQTHCMNGQQTCVSKYVTLRQQDTDTINTLKLVPMRSGGRKGILSTMGQGGNGSTLLSRISYVL